MLMFGMARLWGVSVKVVWPSFSAVEQLLSNYQAKRDILLSVRIAFPL